MLISIRDIQRTQTFSGRADLSGLRLWGETIFPTPVAIEGSVLPEYGEARVDYTATYALRGRCARCLADILREGSASFSHPVKENPAENERADVIPAPGGMLDMGELAGTDLLLEFARPLLCREDCKGWCPQCGADLNLAGCGCANKKKVDPRFAALMDFIED